jgi:hypothetical protein
MDLWPAAIRDLFDEHRAKALLERLPKLKIVEEGSRPPAVTARTVRAPGGR